MLTVNYKCRIGYYTMKQKRGNKIQKYRIHICHSNSLCAMMHFYKENDEDMAQLVCFFIDMPHAKRCIKEKVLGDCNDFVFKAKECNSDMWKLIRLLAESGKKVTIK